MKAILATLLCVFTSGAFAQTSDPAQRLWIAPFENLGPGAPSALQDRGAALAELLVVFFSHAPRYAVVERQALEKILAEHALAATGLVEGERRQVGRLLGAKHLVTGSVVLQQDDLFATAVVIEIETSRVVASALARGGEERAAEVALELFRSLDEQLWESSPGTKPAATDHAPVANLHFLRGLSSYYAARYNQAIADFLHAQGEPALTDSSRLWSARCHIAAGRRAQAYLELSSLRPERLTPFERDLALSQRSECRARLSSTELRLCRQLIEG